MTRHSVQKASKHLFAMCFAFGLVLSGFSTAQERRNADTSDGKETTNADPVCRCLQEKRDLWLCGLADGPTPPYDTQSQDQVNTILVESALQSRECEKAKSD